MMKTVVVRKDMLKGLFDMDSLNGTAFKVTIMPISEEADEIEFKNVGFDGVTMPCRIRRFLLLLILRRFRRGVSYKSRKPAT